MRMLGTISKKNDMNVILLRKFFSENQRKIFRTQMLYIARSELG